MTLRIGIIGAENSHAAAIARVINVDKLVKGFSVDYLWGETDEFARKTAEKGQIPHIVKRQSDMLGKIDALMVDHRHGKYHLAAARPFVEAGVPTFVDKPFCYRAAEGREFLKLARRCKTPVTSFSIIPLQRSFLRIKKEMAGVGRILAGATYGPCDLKSPYGGVFFYGLHQVAVALAAFGDNVVAARLTANGNGATGTLLYGGAPAERFVVTLNFIVAGLREFEITVAGEKGVLHRRILKDKVSHLAGARRFTAMFKTGVEPETHEHILKHVEVLEALEKSLKTGRIEKVGR